MSNISENNKRIAKNTMVLYVRMFVMMLISFFTAGITLNALGVDDYGINNENIDTKPPTTLLIP